MKTHRIDHLGIIVDDLQTAKAFFLDLGFELQWEGDLEGDWIGEVIGLKDVKLAMVVLGLPDGQTSLEISKFYSPADNKRVEQPLANTLGIRHFAVVVEDIEAIVAKLKQKGIKLIGEVVNYENTYKLCYLRGPEGIIIELAEEINKG